MYPSFTLRVCIPHRHGSSICYTHTKLNTLSIFSQTELQRRVDALAPLWDCMSKVSFRRTQRYIALFNTELRADRLAVAHLRFYILSCTAASGNENVKNLFIDRTAVCLEWSTLRLLFGALSD